MMEKKNLLKAIFAYRPRNSRPSSVYSSANISVHSLHLVTPRKVGFGLKLSGVLRIEREVLDETGTGPG